jgi:AraC-like DNA-binding protein
MTDASPPAAWREGVIHPAYVRIAIALAERMGLVVGMRLPEGARMLSVLDVVPLLEQLGAVRNPYLGMELGSLIPASAHGAMGYAVVSSPTVGEAMHTLARYASMRNRFFHYQCQSDGAQTRLVLTPRMPLGPLRTFCEIGTAVSVFKMIQGVAGDEAAAHMHFDAHWDGEVPLNVPMQMHYDQLQTALRVPQAIARKATPTADAKLYASACRSCEEELAEIDGSLVSRLRTMMPGEQQDWPSLKEAAERLAMSPRTLIRRLVAEGVTYQSLLDESKSEMACWLLKNTKQPMSAIAERLGFVDDTNFSRSFRRWRGSTPLEYRKSRSPN